MDLTSHWVGVMSLVIFILAYGLVISEEFTHLRKSKPVLLAAGLIWGIIGIQYMLVGDRETVEPALREYLTEFAELFLFLLVAMTYVNTMSERRIFDTLRSWLVARGYTLRTLFWITGILSFFLSALIDNLTTALVMSGVVLAVGRGDGRFVAISCINIVVAANAGGAFSPFGDITTLMVWQSNLVHFSEFLTLFLPSVVNFLVPSVLMSFAIHNRKLEAGTEKVSMRRGARRVMLLFALTITMAVCFHNFLHLPPFMGMITGLALLQLFGYFLRRTETAELGAQANEKTGDVVPFDSFREIARAEWDTLLFFFGVIMSVGGLAFLGYLAHVSAYLYGVLGPTTANILIGIISAVVDNIPVMVAVLHMHPDMNLQQWLLVTLTAGTGGSLLSVGSAAGVALMGQARGVYTFFTHLRWTPAIALGYAASIWLHLALNQAL